VAAFNCFAQRVHSNERSWPAIARRAGRWADTGQWDPQRCELGPARACDRSDPPRVNKWLL